MNKQIFTIRVDFKDETKSLEECGETIEDTLWYLAKTIILKEKVTENELSILNELTIILREHVKCNQSEIYMIDFENGGYIRTKVPHPTNPELERHLVACNPSITTRIDNFGTYQCWSSFSTKKGSKEIVDDETKFYYFEKVS